MSLLLAGGATDPNFHSLEEAAHSKGVPVVNVKIHGGSAPKFDLDVQTDQLLIDGEPVSVKGAFIRYDVFSSMEDSRPEVSNGAMGWFAAVNGWLLAHPEVRILNRDLSPMSGVKLTMLSLARQFGLAIPATRLTNDESVLRAFDSETKVAKPVHGGGHCEFLSDALDSAEFRDGVTAIPALVQDRLVAPEIRIYIIGAHTMAFEMRSESLDYRVFQDAEVVEVPVPKEAEALRAMMDHLRMDFGAADFKTNSQTGELTFLELNTSPMFARFDYETGGKVNSAMLETLMGDV